MSKYSNIPYERSLKYWCEQNGRQDLIDQYSDKNELPIDQITYGTDRKVIWQMPYDDPKTGNHFDFEWETKIYNRTIGNQGCPYLVNQKVWSGFNDLKTWCELNNRQDLIDQYSDKNEFPIDQVMPGSTQKVIWELPYDDPKTGKHFNFEWKAECGDRTRLNKPSGCPYLSNQKVWLGFNDLKTWCELNNRQDLIDQYSDKNELPIDQIIYRSDRKVIWQMSYDDPKTGKHFDFEWEAECRIRTIKDCGCPYLANHNQKVWSGFNDLKTWCEQNGRQDLIDQYSDKNELPIDQITPASNKTVIWELPYDDPKTGKHFDFEWETKCKSRIEGTDCPYLAKTGVTVWPGFNDFKTWCELNDRQDLIDQYSDKNELSMDQITPASNKTVIWELPYDDPETGKHFNFEWKATCNSRTSCGTGCPYLPPSCSEQESKIYLWLMNHNVDFVREQNFVIGNLKKKTETMKFDIYLPDTNTVVECDHFSHHSTEQKKIDNVRDDFCKQHGIKVLRLPADVMNWRTDLTIINYDDQYKWLKEFLDTGKISNEVIALYDRRSVSNYGDTAREMNSDDFKASYLKTMFKSLKIPKADILKEHTGSNSHKRSIGVFNKAMIRTMAKQHIESGRKLLKTWSKKLNTKVRVRQAEGLVPDVLTGSDFEFN